MNDILPWDQSNQETLESRIIRHEGFCSVPKYDAKGFFCLGFGHDITKAECENYPNGISWDDAEKLLEYDITIVKQNCAKAFDWLSGLSSIRQDVIFEMVYQMGIAGVSAFHGMISCIKNKDWSGSAEHMLASLWHSETPSRSEELANLMKNGYIGNNSTS